MWLLSLSFDRYKRTQHRVAQSQKPGRIHKYNTLTQCSLAFNAPTSSPSHPHTEPLPVVVVVVAPQQVDPQDPTLTPTTKSRLGWPKWDSVTEQIPPQAYMDRVAAASQACMDRVAAASQAYTDRVVATYKRRRFCRRCRSCCCCCCCRHSYNLAHHDPAPLPESQGQKRDDFRLCCCGRQLGQRASCRLPWAPAPQLR